MSNDREGINNEVETGYSQFFLAFINALEIILLLDIYLNSRSEVAGNNATEESSLKAIIDPWVSKVKFENDVLRARGTYETNKLLVSWRGRSNFSNPSMDLSLLLSIGC